MATVPGYWLLARQAVAAVLGQNDAFLHVSILFLFAHSSQHFHFPSKIFTYTVSRQCHFSKKITSIYTYLKKIKNLFHVESKNQKPKPSFRPIANEQQTSNTRVERLPLKIKN